jgi:hypothetical protein
MNPSRRAAQFALAPAKPAIEGPARLERISEGAMALRQRRDQGAVHPLTAIFHRTGILLCTGRLEA